MKIRTGILLLISLVITSILFTYLLLKLNKSEPQKLTVVDSQLADKSYFQEYGIPIVEFNSIHNIALKIQENKNIHVLDIFSHGEDGKIFLGKESLTLANIDAYQEILQQIGHHLGAEGHINVLGCDVAQSEQGKQLIEKIAEYTGVSVAASTDLTGNPQKGGDWDLEYQSSKKVMSAQNTDLYSFNTYLNYPQVLACSTALRATTGADIKSLPGYNEDPADGFPAGKVTIVGDELFSSALKVGGGNEKRFEIEILAPGDAATATFPMIVKYKFRIRCEDSGDCDALFGLTDHIDVNVGGFGNNPFIWAAMDGQWNGTNTQILGAADWSGYSSTVVGLSTTPRDFTLEYTVQSDGSMTSIMSVHEIDGTELHVTPVQTEPNALDLSQGLYFVHFTHSNDPGDQNYVFMGFESVAVTEHCDYGDHNVRYLDAAHDTSSDSTLYMGAAIADIEQLSQNTANGGTDVTGDDSDANGDDEDGVFVGSIANNIAIQGQVFNVGDIVSLNIPTNGTGVLNAWVDWNDDGDFDDVDEQIATNLSPAANVISLSLPISLNSIVGTVNSRFRYGSESNIDWHGEAVDGEVEDHSFIVNGDLDYGDAPDTGIGMGSDNFETLASNGGPYQTINSNLYIGYSAPDLDSGNLQNATATADDTDNNPDESDLNLLPIQSSSTDYKIYIPVTNNVGSTATLVGWIDFNRNGQFEESEGQIVQIPNGVTQVNTELEWNNITPSNASALFLRLRLISRAVTNITEVSSLGGDGSGEIEDHQIVMNDIDLGDAPSSYGIDPSLGGAYHVIKDNTTLYLGSSTIDTDVSGQASSDALGDDNANSDDENGITSVLMPLPLGALTYPVELTVRNTTGSDAYLAGWIDANRNGVFDAIEGQVVTIADGQNGAYTFTFNATQLQYLTSGSSYIRFRFSSDPLTVSDSNGAASNGEVEDYAVLLGGGDFGDLPDTSATTAANNYQTDLANNGPYHSIDGLSSLYLGNVAPDADTVSLQSTNADGDNLDGTNDEEGLLTQALPVLTNGAGYQANVSVTNHSAQDAYLYAWIDWDRDGSFEPDELIQQAVTVPYGVQLIPASSGTQTYSLSWLNDVATVNNQTYGVRLRVTTEILEDDTNTATIDERSLGFAANGEVEDYFLTANNLDLGDAPDSYQTLILSDGPAHAYVSNLYLGAATIDSDVTVTPSINSDSDDNTSTDDETGIDQPLPLVSASATSFSVELSAYNASGSMATLVAWLDKNQDGRFSADEVVDDLNVAANGTPFTNATFSPDNYPTGSDNRTNKVTLTWNGLSGLSQGTMGLRIRIANTSLNTNDWGGFANGGEVEDYTVSIGEFDFGDAEDGASGTASGAGDYRSTLSDNGPYHGLNSTLFMGAAMPDAENDANASSATMADGDDTNSSDDEDGVVLPAIDNSPVPSSHTATVNVTNNTGSDATLYGWIDFDRNGRFDADEMASVTVPTGTTSSDIAVTWSSFPGITTGYTLSRFRLTTDTLTHLGAATAEDERALGGQPTVRLKITAFTLVIMISVMPLTVTKPPQRHKVQRMVLVAKRRCI